MLAVYQKLRDPLPGFIPGVYIRHECFESGEDWDIVQIYILNKNAGVYRIIRRGRFEQWMDETIPEIDYRLGRSTGYYNNELGCLRENETGILLRFDTRIRCLYYGTTRYEKI